MSLIALSLLFASIPPGLDQGPQGMVDPRDHNLFMPLSSIARGRSIHTNVELYIGLNEIGHYRSPAGGRGPFVGAFSNPPGLWPAQVAGAYNVSGSGAGVIAIVDAYDYPTALTDFNTFATQFGLPTESSTNVTSDTNSVFQVVYASGSKPNSGVGNGWTTEEALDIEWAHAMAPSAKIVLVEAKNNNNANLYAAVQVASAIAGVREVSMSWGGGEDSGETSNDAIFSSRSILYLAATGDGGAGVIYPSTSPNVLACGGTSLTVNGSNQWASESGWNGSGGGPSAYENRPSYQNGIALVGTKRGVPDISAVADPNTGVAVFNSGTNPNWGQWGGTSLATPVLAGIHNASTTVHRSSEWIWIYSDTGLFHDIITGNNGYGAGTGYDFVTGIGTPRASTSL